MAKDLEIFARREGSNLAEAHWLARLAEIYPGDPGVLAPLLLNLVTLMPGEGLFIRPGTIHSYLEGSGVEVMSSSDNVVRAGLTSKHVDENELLDLAVKNPLEPRIISPEQEAPGILHYSLSNEEVDEFTAPKVALAVEQKPRANFSSGEGSSANSVKRKWSISITRMYGCFRDLSPSDRRSCQGVFQEHALRTNVAS